MKALKLSSRFLIPLSLLSLVTACATTSDAPATGEPAASEPAASEPAASDAASADAPKVMGMAQPDAAALDQAKARGTAVVVNLRGAAEDTGFESEQSEVEARGMRYVNIEFTSPDALTKENVAKVSEAIGDDVALVHCSSGNRAGSVLTLRAFLAGTPKADALAIGKAAGLTRWEEAVVKKMEEWSAASASDVAE